MNLRITAAQRDAFYDQILDRLSGIGDIELALAAGNFENAERLGREYSDELRLLVDDLGIGMSSGSCITLTTPPDVLLRVLPRLRDLAVRLSESMAPQRDEMHELEERNRVISQACDVLLSRLHPEVRSGAE